MKLSRKKILLFNAVSKGGVTYANYLIPISNALKKAGLDYSVINMPDHCEIDNAALEKILEHPVLSINMSEVPNLECDVVISNDAYLGRLLDDSIEAIMVGHGSASMPPTPSSNPFYFSEWLAYWDGLISPSATSINLFCAGLSMYRKLRKQMKIPTPQDALRSDLRSTNIFHINPVKIPALFDLEHPAFQKQLPADSSIVVGLLPSVASLAGENTLYRHIDDILKSISCVLPKALVILRPYPLDLHNKAITDFIKKINNRVLIDNSYLASDVFYTKCHLLITDVSSGSVTFMLRRGRPVIYYLPAMGNSSAEQQWLKEMQDYLPVATSPDALKIQITKATEMFGDPIKSVIKSFVRKEYSGKHIDQFVESFINSHQNRDISQSCAAKRVTSSGRVIDLDN